MQNVSLGMGILTILLNSLFRFLLFLKWKGILITFVKENAPVMADKLPSLFDFDDEDFSQHTEPENKPATPQKEKNEARTSDEASIAPVSESENRHESPDAGNDNTEIDIVVVPQTTIETSKEIPVEISEVQSGTSVFTHSKDLDESRLSEGNKEFLQKDGGLPPPSSLMFSIEMPETESEQELRDDIYDKQISGFVARPSPSFTFEPRQEAEPENASESEADAPGNEEPEWPSEAEQDEMDIPETEPVAELPEWILEKKYYTIGEVAQLFDVKVSHIRFWTTEFKIKTRTTRKGDRLYTPSQIAELRLIHHLVKVKKHTLKGAKEVLQEGSGKLEKKLDLKAELQNLHQALLQIKQDLDSE